ncbi:ABC transporter ATP-binding protein [Aureliella helgolandensis]|uniref:Putative ABC transporter ATP-binding protein YbhF n=1 Tax=Aureliella helgolandensis TaxID=2527968 RepID=A0A518G8W3_9BACT|nr:ATP-binding cassette domain-containing protein [Aureliella helgolandensis]QDV25012.1 putative ABC transporter ATP-binding protein YbhF [Aureliella helgolandensis]
MITASELVKRFEWAGQRVEALNGINFSVASGEVFGLLGPNGAGKTTTLRIVMGLLRPDSGYAEVGGIRTGPDSAAVRAQIGMVSTNDGVYPWLTVREMLLYFADLYAVPMQLAKQRLEQISERLELGRFIDQRCCTLSTGQKQRVILARGLMHDPPVMLLDEPTRGLDVVGSQTVFQFISHLKELGKAVLLSTHRLDEAERVCDRFGLLHRGCLMYTGTLPEIREATGKKHLTEMFLSMMHQTDVSLHGDDVCQPA